VRLAQRVRHVASWRRANWSSLFSWTSEQSRWNVEPGLIILVAIHYRHEGDGPSFDRLADSELSSLRSVTSLRTAQSRPAVSVSHRPHLCKAASNRRTDLDVAFTSRCQVAPPTIPKRTCDPAMKAATAAAHPIASPPRVSTAMHILLQGCRRRNTPRGNTGCVARMLAKVSRAPGCAGSVSLSCTERDGMQPSCLLSWLKLSV
jgi:hypothetical protein